MIAVRILHVLRLGPATTAQIAWRLSLKPSVVYDAVKGLRKGRHVQMVGSPRKRATYCLTARARARLARDEQIEDEILRRLGALPFPASPALLESVTQLSAEEVRGALARLRAWGHLRVLIRQPDRASSDPGPRPRSVQP